jgi:hypothetical protein
MTLIKTGSHSHIHPACVTTRGCKGSRFNGPTFKVITQVLIIIQVFWDITPCRMVNVHRILEGGYCLHFQVKFVSGDGITSQSKNLKRELFLHFTSNSFPISKKTPSFHYKKQNWSMIFKKNRCFFFRKSCRTLNTHSAHKFYAAEHFKFRNLQ